MAKLIITQLGGYAGELGAALRYLCQRYTMPDGKGKALLTDIGTEELGHAEMISAMVYQLMKGATIEEIKEAGLTQQYVEHGLGIYPTDTNGIPFDASTFAVTGDPIVDLMENMAAEEKARKVYEYLMTLTDDPDLLNPLSFLRQREVVHFERFKELRDEYIKRGIK